MTGRVLVVDDELETCAQVDTGLSARGHEVRWKTDVGEALLALEQVDFDAVLCDLELGDQSGIELCRQIVSRRPDMPVVVMTAVGTMDAAIAAIRAGAYDFVHKPLDLAALTLTVERAIRHHRLTREVRLLQQVSTTAHEFEQMLGESAAMHKVYDILTRLTDSDAAVLVTGESGTGKELVARALHHRSAYGQGPFVAVNCAAVPSSLLESTLFGHVRGAFTDANVARKGLFLEADGGTLFLDEIGEMALEVQSKLLRVLQEHRVRPVGGSHEIAFDTRIVTATNRDLEDDIHEGRFREDLFYRINVVTIHVPPLRARGNDVLLLAQHFLEQVAERTGKSVDGITPDAARKLLDYEWPGNVRQLQNVMERAVALTRFDKITVDDLPDKVLDFRPSQWLVQDDDPANMLTLGQLEQRYIERVLRVTGGNKTQAAKILGLDRRTLYRKLARYLKSSD